MSWWDGISWNPIDWFAQAFVTNRPVADAALNISVPGILYGIGAGINDATGGQTPAHTLAQAATNTRPVTYSAVTQWASGYLGDTPGSGSWNAPVLNAGLPAGVGNALETIVDGTLGLLPGWLLPAALVAGAVYLGANE